MDMYWRAANYLSVGQIYLLDNPLLSEPLRPEHVKPRLLGHWGTTPGLNFVYVHMNRVDQAPRPGRDLRDRARARRPGDGGERLPRGHLQRGLSRHHPGRGGHAQLFRQFSFPGGIPSHVAPETPGSIHEGGELGYALAHAYGAAFDNPDLVVCCVIGDGEAETGPLAASWHSNKFLDPVTDGAVLPILHLNGYKIANPTVLARIPGEELRRLLRGLRLCSPTSSKATIPTDVHQLMAARWTRSLDEIAGHPARRAGREDASQRPRWPMIVLRTPKGWTGPKEVDGLPVEGTFRSHQVPLARGSRRIPSTSPSSRPGCAATGPRSSSTPIGALVPELAALSPGGDAADEREPACQRRPAAPATSSLPDFRDYAVEVAKPGPTSARRPGCSATSCAT